MIGVGRGYGIPQKSDVFIVGTDRKKLSSRRTMNVGTLPDTHSRIMRFNLLLAVALVLAPWASAFVPTHCPGLTFSGKCLRTCEGTAFGGTIPFFPTPS